MKFGHYESKNAFPYPFVLDAQPLQGAKVLWKRPVMVARGGAGCEREFSCCGTTQSNSSHLR